MRLQEAAPGMLSVGEPLHWSPNLCRSGHCGRLPRWCHAEPPHRSGCAEHLSIHLPLHRTARSASPFPRSCQGASLLNALGSASRL